MAARPSVFLHEDWNEDAEYACCPVLKDCGASTLRHLLVDFVGERKLAALKTTAQLRAAAKKCKLHERKLQGAEALKHRAGIVVSMLSRLERRAPDARAALTNATLERRGQWVLVTQADHETVHTQKCVNAAEQLERQLETKVKKVVQTRAEKRKAFLVANQKAASAGAAVSAVDGRDALLANFDATERAIDLAFRKRKPITFRMAPFYHGWVEAQGLLIDGVRFCVLAYGSLALFDREAAPRKKLASLKLHGAVVAPKPSDRERKARVEVRRGNRRITLRPPPPGSKYHRKAAPLLDIAAVLIVAIGHANGSRDIKALEVFRRAGAADDTAAMQPTLDSSASSPATPMVRIRAPSPSPSTPASVLSPEHDASPAPATPATPASVLSPATPATPASVPSAPSAPATPSPAAASTKRSFWEARRPIGRRTPAPAPETATAEANFLAGALAAPAAASPAVARAPVGLDTAAPAAARAPVDRDAAAPAAARAPIGAATAPGPAASVAAGTAALRIIRRRHALRRGWSRLLRRGGLPQWDDTTDEDDVYALAPATTPVEMRVRDEPSPGAPATPPFAPVDAQATLPSSGRKIVRRLVRRVLSATKDGEEVVIIDGKRMRRIVRRVGDAPSGGKRVRRVRVIKRRPHGA